MAPVTKTRTIEFGFDEPNKIKRGEGLGGSWQDNEAETAPVDALIDTFLDQFGTNGAGYSRKVSGFVLKDGMRKDSKRDPVFHTASRINQRCTKREVDCHAKVIQNELHMVTGKKVIHKRKSKKGAAESE